MSKQNTSADAIAAFLAKGGQVKKVPTGAAVLTRTEIRAAERGEEIDWNNKKLLTDLRVQKILTTYRQYFDRWGVDNPILDGTADTVGADIQFPNGEYWMRIGDSPVVVFSLRKKIFLRVEEPSAWENPYLRQEHEAERLAEQVREARLLYGIDGVNDILGGR